MKRILLLAFFTGLCIRVSAQKPEHQVSFALENRTHAWYVEQAGLWWKEVQKDKTSESAWYNYFRACRNAQGSADWKTDFVKDGPSLRLGPDILAMMHEHIPGTVTYNYLVYLNQGIGTDNGDKLLRAYNANPDYEDIASSVITYAHSSLNDSLRAAANKRWYKKGYHSPQLLVYAYNVLQSVEPNAVLFTENDNDTYPVWMLQDALGIRRDVTVLNVDFMLIDTYRTHYMALLGLPPMPIPDSVKDVNIYEQNWTRIMHHILANYSFKRPLHLGLTVRPELYAGFEEKLAVCGLTQKFCKAQEDLFAANQRMLSDTFLLEALRQPVHREPLQQRLDYHNLAYVNMLKVLYDGYTAQKKPVRAAEVRRLAIALAERTGDAAQVKGIATLFGS